MDASTSATAPLRILPTLDELAAEPAGALDLSPVEAATMLARVEGLAAVLRIAAISRAEAPAHEQADRLLTVEQVAERLGLTPKQVYRRARRWSFTRQEGPRKTLRFSENGLARHMAGKRR